MGIDGSHESGAIPDLDALPAPVRALYETAFGEATGQSSWPRCRSRSLALVCVLLIREVPLRTTLDLDGAREERRAPADDEGPADPRESLRRLEAEVGVLIRRIRRVIHERARAVHEDMQPRPTSCSLAGRRGPVRASAIAESFGIDKGAIPARSSTSSTSAWSTATPDPDDGRATLVAASDDAVRRMADVAAHRRKWMDERLGDWSAAELADVRRHARAATTGAQRD